MAKKHRPPHIHPDNSVLFLTGRIYGGFSYLIPKETKNYFLDKANSVLEKYKIDLEAWVVPDNHYHLLINVTQGDLVSPFVRELHGSTAHYIKKNLSPIVTEFGQRIAYEATPWDRRQAKRLLEKERELERRLKSASTNQERRNALAQFIARHKNHFKPEDYRGLKSAITNGRLTDPAVVVSLIAKGAPVWYQYVDHVIRNEGDYYHHLNYIHQNPVKHRYVKKMSKYEFSSIHRFIEEKGKEWIVGCFRNYPIVDFGPMGIVD